MNKQTTQKVYLRKVTANLILIHFNYVLIKLSKLSIKLGDTIQDV